MLRKRPKSTKEHTKSTQKRHKRAQKRPEETLQEPPGAPGRRPEGVFKKIQKITPRRGATLVFTMHTCPKNEKQQHIYQQKQLASWRNRLKTVLAQQAKT